MKSKEAKGKGHSYPWRRDVRDRTDVRDARWSGYDGGWDERAGEQPISWRKRAGKLGSFIDPRVPWEIGTV